MSNTTKQKREVEKLLQDSLHEASSRLTRAAMDANLKHIPVEFYNPASRMKNFVQFLQDELAEYRSGIYSPPSYDYAAMRIASQYAARMSGCRKVRVGCLIVGHNGDVSFGANRAVPDLCKSEGCQRVQLYGNDSKNHRAPEDCRAIHSEVDALVQAFERPYAAEVYVTRYPCEACARALAAAQVNMVHYGRNQPISGQTMQILASAGVQWQMETWWNEEDTVR